MTSQATVFLCLATGLSLAACSPKPFDTPLAGPAPEPRKPRWCVPVNEVVDTARAVAEANKVFAGGGWGLKANSVRTIDEGYIISLVPDPPVMLGGGGLVWVDGENGCPIILKQYE